MPDRDRDQSVEQMLRRVMSDVPPVPEACLDVETLAAWSEGTLRGAEASTVERHVAGCARCRALTATFLRTTPPAPVTESVWRRWHLGWMVPIATAATAAAIWVMLPNNTATPLPSPQEINAVARDERIAPPPSTPVEEPKAAAATALPAPALEVRPQQERAKVAESANEFRQRADTGATRELAAPSAPPPAVAPAERAEADANKQAAANSALGAAAPTLRRAFAASQILSQDGSARWRIIEGQQVERSTDAGAQWTTATINSPDRLTAGAAPSGTICWIVGARGAVYLTTDGTRFVRLPFTEMIDLTSVFATDALSATVSSADGRSWRTTDQGRTWVSTP